MRSRQICAVCFAFATDDAAELNAHSDACFARAAEREAGAAPAAEARYLCFLAFRTLPFVQSIAVLLTLNVLGTTFRMGLALSSPRWARSSSSLGSVPMLHSILRAGPPPVSALRVPEDVALRICRAMMVPFGLMRFPTALSLFVLSTSPARREWCAIASPKCVLRWQGGGGTTVQARPRATARQGTTRAASAARRLALPHPRGARVSGSRRRRFKLHWVGGHCTAQPGPFALLPRATHRAPSALAVGARRLRWRSPAEAQRRARVITPVLQTHARPCSPHGPGTCATMRLF